MAIIKLEFDTIEELESFIKAYQARTYKADASSGEDESAEKYAQENFEDALRFSTTKRTLVSIKDMETHHLFNALALEIAAGRNRRDERPDFVLSALIWHANKRVLADIKENVICED